MAVSSQSVFRWGQKISINSSTYHVFAGAVATVGTLFGILRCINRDVHKSNLGQVSVAFSGDANLRHGLEVGAKCLIFLGFTKKSRFSVDNFVDIWGRPARKP